MVDVERLTSLVRRLSTQVAYLEARATSDRSALRADEERLSGVKYRFVTALESLVNVAQHLCASESWGPPTSNAVSVRLLGEHGVLDTDLAGRLAGAVGFRNILVHEYATVDDDLVVANLDDVVDLADFVTQVSRWLGGSVRTGATTVDDDPGRP